MSAIWMYAGLRASDSYSQFEKLAERFIVGNLNRLELHVVAAGVQMARHSRESGNPDQRRTGSLFRGNDENKNLTEV